MMNEMNAEKLIKTVLNDVDYNNVSSVTQVIEDHIKTITIKENILKEEKKYHLGDKFICLGETFTLIESSTFGGDDWDITLLGEDYCSIGFSFTINKFKPLDDGFTLEELRKGFKLETLKPLNE